MTTSTGHKNPRSGRYVPDNGATPIFLSKGERFPPAAREAASYRRRKEGMNPLAALVTGTVVNRTIDAARTYAEEHDLLGRAKRAGRAALDEWRRGA